MNSEPTALEVIDGDHEDVQAPAKAVEIRSAFDIRPQQFQAGLTRRGKNRDALMEWLTSALKEGTDWGRLHVVKKDKCPEPWSCTNPYHFSKPSLWKAGAEKIAGMMGFRSTWPNLDAVLERLQEGNTMVILKCQLVDSNGSIVSEGIGARDLKQDAGDINKALKMAKKSGLIDAVLNAGGLSEVFTQDIEDMPADSLADHADPYQQGEQRGNDVSFPGSNTKPVATHCPIGKEWKGLPWSAVDDGFLNWILSNIDDKPDITEAARKELEGRSLESQEKSNQRKDDAIIHEKDLGAFVREIGAATHIDQITVIRDELPAEFLPSVRAFLAKREVELRGQ